MNPIHAAAPFKEATDIAQFTQYIGDLETAGISGGEQARIIEGLRYLDTPQRADIHQLDHLMQRCEMKLNDAIMENLPSDARSWLEIILEIRTMIATREEGDWSPQVLAGLPKDELQSLTAPQLWRRSSDRLAAATLESLFADRDKVDFIKASEDDFDYADPRDVFGGVETDDDFYEEEFLAAFEAFHEGRKFYFRFARFAQEPDQCDPLYFSGLIVSIQCGADGRHWWHHIGIPGDFGPRYSQWRDYLCQRYGAKS